MSTPLDLFPARVRFVDANGLLTREAYLALQGLQIRVGGPTAPSTTDLAQTDDDDSGLEEFKTESFKRFEALEAKPEPVFASYVDPLHPLAQPSFPADDPLAPSVEPVAFTDPMNPLVQEHTLIDQLQSEINGLRELVSVLFNRLNDIEQGATYGRDC